MYLFSVHCAAVGGLQLKGIEHSFNQHNTSRSGMASFNPWASQVSLISSFLVKLNKKNNNNKTKKKRQCNILDWTFCFFTKIIFVYQLEFLIRWNVQYVASVGQTKSGTGLAGLLFSLFYQNVISNGDLQMPLWNKEKKRLHSNPGHPWYCKGSLTTELQN